MEPVSRTRTTISHVSRRGSKSQNYFLKFNTLHTEINKDKPESSLNQKVHFKIHKNKQANTQTHNKRTV